MHYTRAYMFWMVEEGLEESAMTSDWREKLDVLKLDYEEIEEDSQRATLYRMNV